MKIKLLFVIAGLALLTSCATTKYSSKVHGRDVDQQGYFSPMTAELSQKVNSGLVKVTPVPGGTYLVQDSIYDIEPTWNQAWHNSNVSGLFGGLAVSGGTIGTYIGITATATTVSASSVVIPITGILVSGPMIGNTFEWYKWNNDLEIKKSDYSNYQKSPANFWNTKK